MHQRHVVQVIRLITQGTIEEKIYELQQSKRELIETVIQPGDLALIGYSGDVEFLGVHVDCLTFVEK